MEVKGPVPRIVADQLVTGYRDDAGERRLTTTSFTIEPGSIIAVLGPNGVGKTTLLKTILGLLPPLEGTLTVGGMSPASYRRSVGVGYLPETIALPPAWTARGLLALTAVAAGVDEDAIGARAVEIAGVDFDLEARVATLSKGMRQRLALAMALLPPPALLVLDEPEAGLDPAQRVRLRERITSFAREGRVVLFASHDITGLATIADTVYLMRESFVERIERAELQRPERVVDLFGWSSR